MKGRVKLGSLTTEAIQGAALSLQSVYDIEGSDGLAAGVLGVGNSISDDILQEHLHVHSFVNTCLPLRSAYLSQLQAGNRTCPNANTSLQNIMMLP